MRFARRLSDATILAIFRAQGTHVDIACDHDVSPGFVGMVKIGRVHSAITGAVYPGKRKHVVGRALAETLSASPESESALAQAHGLSQATVRKY